MVTGNGHDRGSNEENDDGAAIIAVMTVMVTIWVILRWERDCYGRASKKATGEEEC